MGRARVLTQSAVAKALRINRQAVLTMLVDGRLNRASLNGAVAVKDDAKYQALLAAKQATATAAA